MNILEYIEDLMDRGYTEEEAGLMADCEFGLYANGGYEGEEDKNFISND